MSSFPLVILFFFEICIFLFSFIFSGFDIMSPSTVMNFMFVFSTLFALLNAEAWKVNYSLDSCLILSSGLFVFSLSELLFRFLFCKERKKYICRKLVETYKNYEVANWKLVFLVCVDFLIFVWYFKSVLNIVGASANLNGIFIAYRRMGIASMKDSGSSIDIGPVRHFTRILDASGYVAAYFLINDLVSEKRKRFQKFLYVLLIICSLLPSILSAGRSGILRIASAILVEYYIVLHLKFGWHKNFSWKYVKIAVIGLSIAIPLFYFSLGLLGRTTQSSLWEYISKYIGSSIVAFDLYVKDPVPTHTFGEESLSNLTKVFSALGIGTVSKSYNLEFRQGVANIYSFFRRPLHDFGLGGMYVFTMLVSFLFSWLYFKHIKYKIQSENLLYVLAYGYIFYWMICSSMDQYSQTYISLGTVVYLILIFWIAKALITNFNKYAKIIKN